MNKSVRVSAIVLLLVLFAAQMTAAQQQKSPALAEDLSAKLATTLNHMSADYDGVMGIYVKDLTSGQAFSINPDTIFPQASSIKIPLLIELMRQAQSGKIDLNSRVDIHRAGLVGGSGVLQFFSDGGSSISIHDLAILMILLSDNSATNLLIDRVGMSNVNSMLDGLGLHNTRFARKMIDIAAEQSDRENHSTPREMAALIEQLYARKLLDTEYTKATLEILEYPKESPLRAGVPENITVAEKPGSLNGTQCDSGIVLLEGRPYIISVMTTYNRIDGNPAITSVSRVVFDYFDRLAHANSYGVRVR
ncbi:MAG TPA: serine hydrolase [Candidatus Dormibacteraeota bacterium]|nr:serine hydrolase [Candidatus Dormibacteraeota bacterium]